MALVGIVPVPVLKQRGSSVSHLPRLQTLALNLKPKLGSCELVLDLKIQVATVPSPRSAAKADRLAVMLRTSRNCVPFRCSGKSVPSEVFGKKNPKPKLSRALARMGSCMD